MQIFQIWHATHTAKPGHDFCSCLTEIWDKTRLLELKNNLSNQWKQMQHSALGYRVWTQAWPVDGLDQPKSSSQPRSMEVEFGSWNFQYRLQTDILGVHSDSTVERNCLLTEHLQTRKGHLHPQAVHSNTVFCNLEMVFCLSQMEALWFLFLS